MNYSQIMSGTKQAKYKVTMMKINNILSKNTTYMQAHELKKKKK